MSEVDSIVLKDQMIAQEGVLKYEDGKRKLKKWGNLKKFIGKKAPVINEHPPGKMMREVDRVYAVPNLKQCEDGTKGLCADIEGDDDMPNKRGYSIGFKFHEIEQPGIWLAPNGSKHPYDSIQELTSINHIALTDMPRNNTAIRVGGDSEGDRCEFFGCDAYTFIKPIKTEVKQEVTICPKLVDKLKGDIDAIREPNYDLLEAIDDAKHVEQDTVYSAGDTVKSTSVKDCVGKMISHLFKAHPERWDPKNEAHRKQVTAVAFKKCRAKHGGSAGDSGDAGITGKVLQSVTYQSKEE